MKYMKSIQKEFEMFFQGHMYKRKRHTLNFIFTILNRNVTNNSNELVIYSSCKMNGINFRRPFWKMFYVG